MNETTGQGTQRVGMTSPWLDAFPSTTKHFLDETDSILGTSLSGIITYGPNSTLTATENAQPAIMATSILILRILEQEFGFKLSWHVDVTLGHSLGEFAALVAAGYLSYADALLMVRKRAEIMAECTRSAQSGPDGAAHGMVAVICEDGHLEDMISATHSFLYPNSTAGDDYTEPKYVASESSDTDKSTVSIANINSRNQIVLSGSLPRISALLVHLRHFTGHDPRAVRLNADSAFHNPIMAPAAEYMRTALSSTSPSDASNPTVIYPPNLPCISNVSALPFSSAQSVIDLLSRQATETVRWWDSIRYLDQVRGVKRWIGLGPGKVGRNLVGKEVGRVGRMRKGGGVWAVTGPEDMEALMEAIEEVEREDVESDGDGRE